MTGGFSVVAVGSGHQVVRNRACSESTHVMSCLVVLFLLNALQNKRKKAQTNRTEPRVNQRKKTQSAASTCVTGIKTKPLHWFSGFHDYSWGNHRIGWCFYHTYNTHIQTLHTLRAFWAGSLEPMTIRPGPPMLQKLFRCSPSSTGTVDTA